jgi:DNA-binding MltR family transcriptional regulator
MARPHDFSLVDYNKIVEQFHGEPDRSAAIVAASFAECFVEKLLRRFMRQDHHTDQLFGSHGPLASFAACSDLAYALGFINDVMHSDLGQIRKVRNHFAHHPGEAGFETSPVKDHCQNLSTSSVAEGARDRFLFAVGLTVGQMHNIILARDRQEQSA